MDASTQQTPAQSPGSDPKTKRAHPALWVPSLYLAMGTPMIAVTVVSAIMYKNLGLSNAQIALYTGSMYLPWVVKPLWAPIVEMFRTKKFFVLTMQLAMMVTLGCVALALPLGDYLPWTIAFFWITGFASATQDIAADGVYISSMDHKEQALYVGIQGIFWNLGRVISSGLLVTFTGILHSDMKLDWVHAWMVVMGILAAFMGLAFVWHLKVLPTGGRAADTPANVTEALGTFTDAFVSFFRKKSIWMMIAMAYFYRFGEGFIDKIGPLFLLDSRDLGGLGLNNVQLGNINGTYGTVAFIVGALVGGLFSARLGLRRSFFFLVVALNIPHVTYLYLSQFLPESLWAISIAVTIEKFGYGFGSVGHMLYMMQQMAPGPYKTAHYAFATGIMGLCMMSTGMVSGALQEWLGYQTFFIFAMVVSLIPMVMAWNARFPVSEGEDKPVD
ncbi:MAG: MFS transporter [Deltaproteobacteria bacterium]|nr:MFS transporter [Deltaproteobacteria bacterium]